MQRSMDGGFAAERGLMKRLVVVADNSLIVEAIRIGLRQCGTFSLGHVNAHRCSLQAIRDARPDVLLIDDMERSDQVLDLIKAISSEDDRVAVIALTVDMDSEWLDELFAAGARGVISKGTHPAALGTLLRETVNGHVVHFSKQPGATVPRRPRRAEADDASLTDRELEVLRLVAAGSTNGEIARILWVTEQTVKFHLSNVYRKLDVGNRTQASHYAHVNGLVNGKAAVAAP